MILISYAAVLKRSAKKKLESLYAKRKQREYAAMLNLPNFDNSDLQSQITVSDRISDMVRQIESLRCFHKIIKVRLWIINFANNRRGKLSGCDQPARKGKSGRYLSTAPHSSQKTIWLPAEKQKRLPGSYFTGTTGHASPNAEISISTGSIQNRILLKQYKFFIKNNRIYEQISSSSLMLANRWCSRTGRCQRFQKTNP